MANENEQPTSLPVPKQICRITIMLPVETDEQAIECKHKIESSLSDIAGVQLDFRITNIPAR